MNNRLFYFVLVILFLYSSIIFAASPIGKIIKLKAPVTILELGKKEAYELKEGDGVTEGGSILTQEKSFAIVMFNDGHKLTITPNSKIVITQVKKDQPDVVQLLMGKIRASVRPDQERKAEKFFIKTRSAAMGVRGTEFQAGFNPENKVTTLLTFSGKVAMNKVDEKTAPIENEQKVVEQIREVLKAPTAVETKVGDYAGTAGEKIAPPVKISPVQFTLLKINQEPEQVEELPKEELEKEIQKTKEDYAKVAASEEVKVASIVRPGGLVDLNSGFYVPPTEKSEFDQKTQVYVQKEDIGTVAQNGAYIPPVGLKIDAVKGFIVDEAKKKSDSEEMAKKLNGEIEKQVVPVIKKSTLEEDWGNPYDKYYKRQ